MSSILMNGIRNSDAETAGLRLYLDESGGEDPRISHVIVGGLLINYAFQRDFEESWADVLERYRLEPPLHMREFGRPHGRFAKVSNLCRFELFSEIAELINGTKAYTVSAALSASEYRDRVSRETREKFSMYAMCFMLALVMAHQIAAFHSYSSEITFILDTGNQYTRHIVQAHAEALKMQRNDAFMNVGGLYFEDDRHFAMLQAADVVAWGARRKATGTAFGHGFSPIARILESYRGHANADWQSDWLAKISRNVMKQSRGSDGEHLR